MKVHGCRSSTVAHSVWCAPVVGLWGRNAQLTCFVYITCWRFGCRSNAPAFLAWNALCPGLKTGTRPPFGNDVEDGLDARLLVYVATTAVGREVDDFKRG
jgi:hypothetical protein